METEIILKPIGFVQNIRKDVSDDFWGGLKSTIHLAGDMPAEALLGIEEFSHLEIIYYFHKAEINESVKGASHPRNNPLWPTCGIFVQRKKDRPNQIGATVVKLVSKGDRSIVVEALDAIDGTPVLDIKPYVREFYPEGATQQPEWCSELMKDYWKKRE